MPLTIRVHERLDDGFNPPPQISKTWLWMTPALEVLKGERDGDKEKALEILTYWRGYWEVTLPRTGHTDCIITLGDCQDEKTAIKKAKRFAETKWRIYDIDEGKPATAVRFLYDAEELPAEYQKYAPKD